jgi:hypothetical protein
MEPRPQEILVEDIAHALSMLCRFNGHGKEFYSVAEHSLHVAAIVSPPNKKWGLLHDAAEAYLSDIPSPVKKELKNFQEYENNLLLVISQKFNLEPEIPLEVKDADEILLATEKIALMGPEPASWDLKQSALDPAIIKCYTPMAAKRKFLEFFKKL